MIAIKEYRRLTPCMSDSVPDMISREADRQRKPTIEEISEAVSIVEDFGVHLGGFPSVKTVAELDAWRRRKLKEAFHD